MIVNWLSESLCEMKRTPTIKKSLTVCKLKEALPDQHSEIVLRIYKISNVLEIQIAHKSKYAEVVRVVGSHNI